MALPRLHLFLLLTSLFMLPYSTLVAAQRLQPGQHIAITGAQTGIDAGTGRVPVRRDVVEFSESGDEQWDLYVLALNAMYAANITDKLSYYQIAGIHGLPHATWDGDQDPVENSRSGYCPHGWPTFVSWHRPYLMLFEQTLVSHALRIAEGYPPRFRAAYRRAAETLRAPYWDWADAEALPAVVSLASLTIRVPSPPSPPNARILSSPASSSAGNSTSPIGGAEVPPPPQPGRLVEAAVPNPLSGYAFPRVLVDGAVTHVPLNGTPAIARCSSEEGGFPAAGNRRLRLAQLKSQVRTTVFVENSLQDFMTWSTNLENVHNVIHTEATCGEQFLYLGTSGFEPLFWLHHANVDRLAALAEAISPSAGTFAAAFLAPAPGLFTTAPGETVGQDSHLRPFRGRGDTLLTTRAVSAAFLRGLGYTYPGLEYWNMTAAQLRASAVRVVRETYGANLGAAAAAASAGSAGNSSSVNGTEAGRILFRRRRRRRVARAVRLEEETRVARAVLPGGETRVAYVLRMELNREDVDKPCRIQVWVGEERAGTSAVLGAPEAGKITIRMPLDGALGGIVGIPGSEAAGADVARSVRIEIQNARGEVIPVDSVKSLELGLETVGVTVPASMEELPRMGEAVVRPVGDWP